VAVEGYIGLNRISIGVPDGNSGGWMNLKERLLSADPSARIVGELFGGMVLIGLLIGLLPEILFPTPLPEGAGDPDGGVAQLMGLIPVSLVVLAIYTLLCVRIERASKNRPHSELPHRK
jgi:hypothetical protein